MLKKVVHATKGYRLRILITCLIGLSTVALSLCFVWSSKMLIDVATGRADGAFSLYAVVTVIVLLSQILLQSLNSLLSIKLNTELSNSLRSQFFDLILKSEWNQAEKYKVGDLQTRLLNDVSDIVSLVTTSLPQMLVSMIDLLAAFVFLYYLNSLLAISIVVVTPLFLVLSKVYFKKMRQFSMQIKESDSLVSSMINESLSRRMILKTFEYATFRSNDFKMLQNKRLRQITSRSKYSVFSNLAVGMCFVSGYLIVFIWGAWQIKLGLIGFGTMTAFLQLSNRIQSPALSLLHLIPTIINTRTAIDRIHTIEEMSQESTGTKPRIEGRLSLNVDNVRFSYDDRTEVLNDVCMSFPDGSFTTIMGETGAGKTTILRLLLGLVKPKSGKVYLTDSMGMRHEVSELTRSNFVYVPQGNTLFATTIRDNILIGNPNADDKEIERALHIAVADFVATLPDGIDTELAENGVGLSEGQAQRIAIARALLRPGGVFVFDEATSALDTQTEQLFLERLKKECADKTIIFISHHTAMEAHSDNVYRL